MTKKANVISSFGRMNQTTTNTRLILAVSDNIITINVYPLCVLGGGGYNNGGQGFLFTQR